MTAATVDTAYTPFVESDAGADAATLQATMHELGYLYFRALVPEAVVLQVRRDVLELCREAGWLHPGRELMDAVAAPGMDPLREGLPPYQTVYRKILRTPSFHDFPAVAELVQIAQKLLDVPCDEVFIHPRRIGRVTFPHLTSATTPAHQDHFYIRGTVDTYSCWTPLGECPIELGGLAVAPYSQQGGYIEHTEHHPGAVGGVGVPIDDAATLWHSGDFGLGDALYFTSYTIHKALPNLTADRLRLSTDNRYQRPKEAIDPSALLPHLADLPTDEK